MQPSRQNQETHQKNHRFRRTTTLMEPHVNTEKPKTQETKRPKKLHEILDTAPGAPPPPQA